MWHVGRVFAFGTLLAVIAAICTTSEVNAQKKKAAADNGFGATPQDYVAIQNRKELVGTIVASSGKVVTIKVDTPHMEPNPKFKAPSVTNPGAKGYNPQANQQYKMYQQAQKLQRDLQQAQTANNPQERQRAMQRYYQDLNNFQRQTQQQQQQLMTRMAKDPNYTKNNANNTVDPFILVHSYKEYDLETTDAVTVKKSFVPFEYDDMGNIKKYSEKELAALRDEKNKSLFKSKIEEVAAGMEARLTLVAPPKKAKDLKPDDEGVGNVDRPTVTAILLTKDSPQGANIPAADPKKKKK